MGGGLLASLVVATVGAIALIAGLRLLRRVRLVAPGHRAQPSSQKMVRP